jgi:hypothetical protein
MVAMKSMNWIKRLMVMLLAVVLAGCDDGTGHGDYDVNPSGGNGALVVKNESSSDFDVYVGGQYLEKVHIGDFISAEYPPGVIRVLVRQSHGDHLGYGDDVDILNGKRSILHIYDHGWNDFETTMEYD